MRPLLLPLPLLALLAATSAPAAEADATARTKALVAAFQRVDDAAGDAAFTAIDDFLDFDTLTRAPLEGRTGKFTEAQLAEFRATFRELIRRASYASSGAFFRQAEVNHRPARKQGDVTVVELEARLPDEDLETVVGLHWKKVRGALRVVDVSFDGDSLILDYRNQFAGIVDRDGAAGLLRLANERLAALREGKE